MHGLIEAMAETASAAAAAKRGVDIVVDQLVDGAKYVYRIWSAYGANGGDAQDVADYADHVTTLLQTIQKSESVSTKLMKI